MKAEFSVVRGRGEVVVKPILTLLRTVKVAAQPAVTTSEEYFEEVGVVWTNDTFKAEFYGLEVPATEETELVIRRLEEDSLDKPILDELGNRAEISVSQFRAFLADSRESPEWFVFYLKKGKDGKLWAVLADWSVRRGWSVRASSVGGPSGWRAGGQVLSQV